MARDNLDLLPFLHRLTSRSALTEQERHRILQMPSQVKQVRTDHDFVERGECVSNACLVVAGLIARFDQNARGDRQITALHIPGDMPDMHSTVQPVAVSALQSLTTSTVLLVPHSALRAAARDHPGIAEALWRDCMVDTGILAQWVVNIGLRDARSRIAHLLCEMAWRYRAAGPETRGHVQFVLPMTQSQLADATGLTPVHVNRSLMALRPLGVTIHAKVVRIDDWDVLAAVADFDPDYLQMHVRPECFFRGGPQRANVEVRVGAG